MSDSDEPATKRPHQSDDKVEDDDESADGWIGPLPTDAAPVKKRKGKAIFSKEKPLKCVLIVELNMFQFWSMKNYTWKIYQMPNAMRKVTCIEM